MFTNVWISGLFVIVSVVVFIVLCYKGMHTGIAAILAAVIASFGSKNPFYVSAFDTFSAGAASMVQTMIIIFTISGLLGYLMDETGCSKAVGNTMVKLLGTDRAWVAISATAVILMLAGVGTFMYVVVVICGPLMKASNLPRKIGMIAAAGIAPAINFCMPVPNVPGGLVNNFLGTGIYDAPILSIATGMVGIVLFVLYQVHLVKQCRKNGEGWDGGEVGELALDDEDLPSFATSVIPLVAVVVAAILFGKIEVLNQYQTWSTQMVGMAQLVGVLLLFILHWNRCKKIGIKKILSVGCTNMWPYLVLASCVYGYGKVVCDAACMESVQNWVLTLNMNPYVTAMISIAIIAGLCTDGISALMIWMPMFGQSYIDMGVNAGALRRLMLCTTQTFDSLPHAQSTAINLSLFGLNHKQAYKELFVTTVIIPVIFSLFCCACCILFY